MWGVRIGAPATGRKALIPAGFRLGALAALVLLVAAAYAGSAHECLHHPGHTCLWGVFSHTDLPGPAAAPQTVALVTVGWHTSPAESPGELPAARSANPSRAPPA